MLIYRLDTRRSLIEKPYTYEGHSRARLPCGLPADPLAGFEVPQGHVSLLRV